ncbi:type II toxin-antitoxin system ParD family antitoxin [Zobellia sp. 1_MG-2023]|uniref:ribbon-helix-helix domain-containing protein n=1 Tax=Zobellia sp. 1_MG-2023 TaxID=3062626 RepID=UPI0026E29B2E|nr:type II toxin-antitoxin system ParD family antitoxin [Zobellia sp. 1_MG-2023]MDO6818916.1 type II toxin-antitoxin system ParD family antitoxin [Zobellia sp. 1_MG-2023]
MNIKLKGEGKEYIEKLILSGAFINIDEIIQDALQLHAHHRERTKTGLLRKINSGWNGPDSKNSINDIISAKRNTEGI